LLWARSCVSLLRLVSLRRGISAFVSLLSFIACSICDARTRFTATARAGTDACPSLRALPLPTTAFLLMRLRMDSSLLEPLPTLYLSFPRTKIGSGVSRYGGREADGVSFSGRLCYYSI